MKHFRLKRFGSVVAFAMAGTIACFSQGAHADVVVDDFSGGVAFASSPSGAFGVWHNAHGSGFSSAAASTLEGSPALLFNDGGFTNGIYTIYEAAIPADGTYTLEALVDVVEAVNGLNGVRALQIGVAVGANAVHRETALAGLTIVGNYTAPLTSADDNANPIQTLTSGEFTASAGDNLLIAISTDVTSGGWNLNSGTWDASHVLLDSIVLKGGTPPPPPPPVEAIVLNDFSSGVAFVSHPNPGVYDTWYNAAYNGFTNTQAATLNGPAMRLNDGGYTNGAYTILSGAIPADGTYTVEALVDIFEAVDFYNGLRGFQIGVAVGANAVHRDGSLQTALPPMTTFGTYIGLTSNDDNGNPAQTVVTNEFVASAGDDILIVFGSDVQSGSWNGNSAAWSGAYALIDDIVLRSIQVEPPPFELILDNDDGPTVYASSGFSTSGATGYNGGTYQFAASGSNSLASWTGVIPEDGYYDVSSIYLAGSNRASVATYEVSTADGIVVGTVDQRSGSLSWNTIGEFALAAGPVTITLNAATSLPVGGGTVIIADAVRIRELPGPPSIDEPEMRIANLLVYDNLNDVGTIQSLINDIVRKRYNAVAVHARYRGDATYFPNKYDSTFPNIEPRSPLVGDVDVLEEVVTRGQAAGLKVFAYVNTMLVTEGSDTDPRPEHVINRFPEWINWERNGGNPQPHTTATEVDGIWLDPALPEVQIYNAQIIGDIVMNYDVDGVMIDRQRYPDTRFDRTVADYGYHPESVARFNAETGKSGLPDPFDTDWWDFRREANTRAMAHIYSTVTAIDPDCLVLSYPIGRFNDAINFNYQDWPNWLNKKVADIVIPQMYTSSNAEFSSRASEHKNAYSGDRFLGITLDVFRPGNDLVGQVNIARTLGYQGTALFAHTAAGALGYFEVLPTAWPGIAAWPEAAWKALPVQCDGYDIIGIAGDSILVGTACDETIIGSTDTDEIYAGAGNDNIIVAKIGNSIIDGGSGMNKLDYSATTETLVVDLTAGVAYVHDSVPVISDSIANIKDVIGNNSGFNTLIGGEGSNYLQGGAGDHDTLKGGAGNDFLNGNGGEKNIAVFDNWRDDYHIGLNAQGHIVVAAKFGDEGADTMMNVQRLRFANGIVHVSKLDNLLHISELYPDYVEAE